MGLYLSPDFTVNLYLEGSPNPFVAENPVEKWGEMGVIGSLPFAKLIESTRNCRNWFSVIAHFVQLSLLFLSLPLPSHFKV